MKKIAYTLLSATLIIAATIKVAAQDVSTQNRQVSGFSAIASGGPFNVHIKMDGSESVKVEADTKFIDQIETVVEGNTLKIQFKDHRWSNRYNDLHKADIYVSARSLNSLTNSGSGHMEVEGTISTSDEFKTVLSGSGNITATIKSDGLRAKISGSGSIKLRGSCGDADLGISGSGQIEARDLKAQAVSAGITGSGDVYITAEKTVSAHITGSGNVVYSGNATITNTHTVGSGRVSRAN
jgi:hypothetical protein